MYHGHLNINHSKFSLIACATLAGIMATSNSRLAFALDPTAYCNAVQS